MKSKENKITHQCNNALNKFNESRVILSNDSTVGEFIEALERFPKNAIVTNPRQDIFDMDTDPTTVGEIINDLKSFPSQCVINNTDPYTMSISEPANPKCNCSNCTCENEDDEPVTSIITETGNKMFNQYEDCYDYPGFNNPYMKKYIQIVKENDDLATDPYVEIQHAGSLVKEELDNFAIREKAKIDTFVSQQKSLVDEEVARQQFRFIAQYNTISNCGIMCRIVNKEEELESLLEEGD